MELKERTSSLSHNHGSKFNQIWKNRKQIYLDLLKDQGLVDSKQKYFDASMSNIMQNVKKNYIMDFMKINKTDINHIGSIRKTDEEADGSPLDKGLNSFASIVKMARKRRKDVIKLAIKRVQKSKEIVANIRHSSQKLKRRNTTFRIKDRIQQKLNMSQLRSLSLPEKIDEVKEDGQQNQKISKFYQALFSMVKKKVRDDKDKISFVRKKKKSGKMKEVSFFMKRRRSRKNNTDVAKNRSLNFLKKGKSFKRKKERKGKPRRRNISFKKLRRRQILDFINDDKIIKKAERSSYMLEKTLNNVSKTVELDKDEKETKEPTRDFSSFLLKIKPHYLNNQRRNKKQFKAF